MARARKSSGKREDVYQTITNTIMELMDKGELPPWRRTWAAKGAPKNLISGKRYNGINVFLLAFFGARYSSPYWVTFKQACAKGGHVRGGEKGYPIIFWKQYKKKKKEGEEEQTYSVLKRFTVFNVDQCEGLEVPAVEECGNNDDPIPACEKIVENYPLPRPERLSGTPSYSPILDQVYMPGMEKFSSASAFYSTLFHELGHSTGHSERLARDLQNTFGDHAYSKEELIAEFTAAYLCGEAGIDLPELKENQAAYLANWRRALGRDPKLVLQAAKEAQKAANFILGTTIEG